MPHSKDTKAKLSTTSKWALIVDDEAEMREILRMQLKRHIPDIKIVESENGADAFQKISRQKFDLVISDLQMPKMDGKTLIQTLSKIDQLFKPANILILSGHLDKDFATSEFASITYMGKPVSKSVFLDYLKKTLIRDVNASAEKQKIAVDIINPFVAATIEIVRNSANTALTKESIYIRTDSHVSGDISAVVALNSPHYLGSMGICFDEPCFLHIVSNMLGMPYTVLNDKVTGAAGQLCNQIFSAAKKKLSESGQEIQTALPSIVIGKGHRIRHMAYGTVIAIKFKTDHGCFTLETVQQSLDDLADKSA